MRSEQRTNTRQPRLAHHREPHARANAAAVDVTEEVHVEVTVGAAEAAHGAHARREVPAAHERARPQAAAEQRHERDGALVGEETGDEDAQPSAYLPHLTKERKRLEPLERRRLARVHERTHEPKHERAVAPHRATKFGGCGVERAVALVAAVIVVGLVVYAAAVAPASADVVAVAVVRGAA